MSAFLTCEGFPRAELISHARMMRSRIKKCLGLPVCVGIGPTKTLAKLANHIAKKRPEFEGVCDFERAVCRPPVAADAKYSSQ